MDKRFAYFTKEDIKIERGHGKVYSISHQENTN
jgi:hypothetical protein